MAPLDPDVPPAGEEIHLPGPSIEPLILAASITVALVGVTTFFPLVVAGVIVTVWVIVSWARKARRDIDDLPLDH